MSKISIMDQIRCIEQVIFQRQLVFNTNVYSEEKSVEFFRPLLNEIRNLQRKIVDLRMMMELAD